ncbi:MAG: PAS domain S-box protein [Thermodesulfovibrionales bacterium]
MKDQAKTKKQLIEELEALRKQAEEALHALSSKQEAILAAVPDIIMEVDANKVYTWANHAGKEFFGEDVIGKEAAFYFVEEQKTYDIVQPLFKGNENIIYVESWQRRKDGEKRLLAWWCRVLKDDRGNVTGALSTARDITESKHYEEALRISEEKYRSVIENQTELVCRFNPDGTFIFVNEVFCLFFGKTKDELIGNKWFPLPVDEDINIVQEKLLTLSPTNPIVIIENRVVSSKGDIHWIQFVNRGFFDLHGVLLEIQSVGRDITERKQVGKTLRMSEERFRILFENIPLGTGVATLEGKVLVYNESLAKIAGYTKEEFLNFNIRNLYQNPEDREPLLKQLQSNGYVRNYEIIFKRKNGTSFYANLTIDLIAFDGEKALLTVVEDITERKLAEESMRESELKYRKLVELTRTGFLILDHRGSVIDANNEYVRLTGHHALAEIVGRRVIEWTAEYEKEKNTMAIEECMRVGYVNNLEIDYVDGQGRITPIEINAFMEGQGETLRIVSLCRDITERKQSEEQILMLNTELEQRVADRTAQLEASNRELGNEITERKKKEEKIKGQNILLEGINWIVREALTIETEEELSSQCLAIAEELTGSKFGFIDELNEAGTIDNLAFSDPGWAVSGVPDTNAPILLKNIPVRGIHSDAIRKGISVIVNDPASHPDRVGLPEGHPPLTAFLGVPLKQGEKVIGLIGLANKESGYDAEDQQNIEMISVAFIEALTRIRSENIIKTLNKELQQSVDEVSHANKELEAFSYSVSHDLRAPLRAIDGFTEILLREYSPKLDDEGKRICSVITGNSKKMGQLIDELLSLSRLGRTEMHFSSIDMNDLANAVYDELTTPEMRQRIDFYLDDLKKASGDPILIRQVWMNLIANAIKFTSHNEQPVISITRREEEEQTVFCVKDNGAGFNMQYADKLFKVFQRLHNEKEFEGTGVGLAIVQRIIHRHGGKVWAEGEVDRGATFWFSIPNK